MATASFNEPRGVGGWLILVVISLVASPIRSSYVLYATFSPLFGTGAWEELTTSGRPAYHHLWASLLVFEFASNLLIIALGLTTLVLLLRESKKTPAFAIAWLGLGVALVGSDYFIADLIPAVAEQRDTVSLKEFVRSIASAVVWIPYFLVSKRVKATFVK